MRKGSKTLIKEIKGHRERMAVFDTTFHPRIDGLSKENEEKICEYYRKRFEDWWGSWIGPKLDEIEAKFEKKGHNENNCNTGIKGLGIRANS